MTSGFGDADAGVEFRAEQGGDLPDGSRAAGVLEAAGSITGNMDNMFIGDLLSGGLAVATGTMLVIGANPAMLTLSGTGFTYDSDAHLSGGSLQTFDFVGLDHANHQVGHISLGFGPPATGVASQIIQWIFGNSTTAAWTTLLQGNDNLAGSAGADLIHGYSGNDALSGVDGNDTLYGGTGNDTISASAPVGSLGPLTFGSTYLRGDDGDDSIAGASGFDDINGNMGNDTAHGNSGDDWVVGGKDQDMLFGDSGDDIVWGNLGSDTLNGGTGNDQVRGGQGDDVVNGGDGNDFVSGDRGNDTITGGAGADRFHGSQDAGIDKVLDFNLSEGDKVMLDPGTTFTVSQVGGDTVIDMGGGNQMILVGVQLSTLPAGTIFLG